MENVAGAEWLKQKFRLFKYPLTHVSVIGTRQKKEVNGEGMVIETYPPHYAPASGTLPHVAFLIKYDDINLDFLTIVFRQIPMKEVVDFISTKPAGRYERIIGFLYEFLLNKTIPIPDLGKGNYIDLLDPEKYITGNIFKNTRWHINDNLLGTRNFCPIVRRTDDLALQLSENFIQLIDNITRAFSPEIFYRALNYLYTKETRSSFLIEKEQPSPDRVNRFVNLLGKAGTMPTEILLSEQNLVRLQNEIVDHRYAAAGYRDFQNYIGQTTYNFKEIIHYICPPPVYLASIMSGLIETAAKTEGSNAVVRAAVLSFGFVFAHPFEDGNGRLHRFLIHDILTRDKLVGKGMIIPVSAHMVNHIKDYDSSLEAFSSPLMQKVKYEMLADNSLVVLNPEDVEPCFKYPDLTMQTAYLAKTIRDTIKEDIYQEMDFLMKYDETKSAIRDIADMPDKNIDKMMRFLHQNNGMLSGRKRKDFLELKDAEIAKMEFAFQSIFQTGI